MQLKTVNTRCFAALLCLVLWSTSALATKYYRYKDEQGKVVIAVTIPPSMVSKGYEILNNQGRVVEVVPPALTQEQIIARDARLEEERLAKIAREKQLEIDRTLRQLYSGPDDAIRVLNRKLEDINALVQSKQAAIESSEKQIADLEEQAADLQRKGIAVPERIDNKIASLEKDIASSTDLITEQGKNREAVKGEFREVIERLEVLTGKKATQSPFDSAE